MELNKELVRVVKGAIAKERARGMDEYNVEVNAAALAYVYYAEQGKLEELNTALDVELLTKQLKDMLLYLGAIGVVVKQCMPQERMEARLAHVSIDDEWDAEIRKDGVLWISNLRNWKREIKFTGDAPANLLTFLTKNRDLLQAPGQDESESQAEQE